jgi:crotonobetainyl-CoA:carnitine CoA-transferase CaiB-like acyl-CoA transferase
MTEILHGVRVLEVADHTFVPSASALLADWGAEVIKIEHVERGDAMRGLAATGQTEIHADVNALFEHSNRGKSSLGLDLTSDDGRQILYRLAATCDVFLTNKLPKVREKLRISVDDMRAANPRIIYARGTGQGERGPDSDKGSYDFLAFYARAGVAMGIMRPGAALTPPSPGPGFGDSLGGLAIAAGIMGALFHLERTGEPTVLDVSLLGTGLWAMGQAMALSMLTDEPWRPDPDSMINNNPLVGTYRTSDDRYVALCCLQAGQYWRALVELLDRPELADDPRFADHESLLANTTVAADILTEVFVAAPVDEWRRRLEPFVGQWSIMQHTLETASDPQTVANGYVQHCETPSGTSFRLVAAPVQYDGEPATPRRAPEFNEHGDEILAGLGLDEDAILDLKIRGVVT